MDESPKHYAILKKPDAKNYMVYHSICRKCSGKAKLWGPESGLVVAWGWS